MTAAVPATTDAYRSGPKTNRRHIVSLAHAALLLLLAAACTDSSPVVIQDAEASWRKLAPTVSILAGQNQQGEAGATLLSPLQIKVIDVAGMPLRNLQVRWHFSAGGGSTMGGQASQDVTVPTDDQGRSSVIWRLGTTTGPQTATATVLPPGNGNGNGITVTFAATATAGAPSDVTVEPQSATLSKGGAMAFKATVRDAQGNTLKSGAAQWHSTNANVAAVDAQGLVTAKNVGTADVVAVVDGKSGQASVQVIAAQSASMSLFGGSAQSGTVGKALSVAPSVRILDAAQAPVAGAQVVWTVTSGGGSTSPTTSSTDGDGVARTTWTLGPQIGEQTLSASSEGLPGVTLTAQATAQEGGGQNVASVTATQSSISFDAISDTIRLGAEARDAAGATVSGVTFVWSTSDASVATTTPEGHVISRGIGTALITVAAACCTVSDTVGVTVSQAAAQMTLSPTSIEIEKGKSKKLTAAVLDEKGQEIPGAKITWSSIHAGIAAVGPTGEVVGLAKGSTEIQASALGITASATATVVETGPAPVINGDTVALTIRRVGGGSGATLVSNGIPLVPGMVFPGGTDGIAVVVNGQEVPIYVETLDGTHRNGSARSILVQFEYSVGSTPIPALLITGGGVQRSTTDRSKVNVTWSQPSAVAVPTSADYLVATDLVGPTLTKAKAPTSPSYFNAYETKFVQYGDQHWGAEAGDWTYTYYDRGLIWYAWWVRTGSFEYWKRGTTDALAYRNNYLINADHRVPPRWSLLEGLEIHYLLTGDETSRNSIMQVARMFNDIWTEHLGNPNGSSMEGRIQARVIMSHWVAWRLGDSSRNWAAVLREDLDGILATQTPGGSYLFTNLCGNQLNYMTGLLHDALIKYHDYFEKDSRIKPAIKLALDDMWANEWIPAEEAFTYMTGFCEGKGSRGPAPDLNLLIANGFGWYYKQTGDQTYRDRGDAVFKGGVNGAYFNGYKQFNEGYRNSFRYLSYRR